MELPGVETRECQKCIHQPPDMDVHSPGIPVERVVPHLLQEPPAGKSHAIVWHQVVKQVKLPRCRIDLTPLHMQHACFPRHQLPRVERLGHQDHQGRPLLFYQTHRSLSSYCANKICAKREESAKISISVISQHSGYSLL